MLPASTDFPGPAGSLTSRELRILKGTQIGQAQAPLLSWTEILANHRRKKQLEKIVRRVRDNAIGNDDYSTSDLVEDVECACAREAVTFDNDLFNELAG